MLVGFQNCATIQHNWLEGSRNQRCNKKGSSYLKPLDPFSSIDPLDQTTEDNIYHQATYPNAEFMQANHDSDDEDEQVTEGSFEKRNTVEILDDEMLYQQLYYVFGWKMRNHLDPIKLK